MDTYRCSSSSIRIIWAGISMKNFIEGFSVRADSDKIEVILRDSTWKPYYKGYANIKNKREMKQLFQDMKDKGIDLDVSKWL